MRRPWPSAYGREVVRQTVVGLVAQTYFSLRSLDEQIVITRETLASRQEGERLLEMRLEGGASSRLDFDQAQALRVDASIQLRELERQRALAQSQMALLTGQPGVAVATGMVRGLPMPPVPPAGLPSSLLARRPDVRQAEQFLASANAQIGVARAAMFPSVTLTGLFGGESLELSDLLKSRARIWSLGFGLTLPIFDAGLRQAQTEQAEAFQREALAAYQGAVQAAFRDVADALTNLRAGREQQADVELNERANLSALDERPAALRLGLFGLPGAAGRAAHQQHRAPAHDPQPREPADCDGGLVQGAGRRVAAHGGTGASPLNGGPATRFGVSGPALERVKCP